MGVHNFGLTSLAYDNSGAIQITNNDVFYEHVKYIEIEFYFIRQHIAQGIITCRFIFSPD